MPETPQLDMQPGTDNVFPLTAMFNASDKLHCMTVIGLYQTNSGNTNKTTLIVRKHGSDSGLGSYECIADVNEAFQECVKAKSEGRYADLTSIPSANPEP